MGKIRDGDKIRLSSDACGSAPQTFRLPPSFGHASLHPMPFKNADKTGSVAHLCYNLFLIPQAAIIRI